MDLVGDQRRTAERTLRFIEETVPTTLIGVAIAEALDNQPVPFAHDRPELLPLLRLVFDELVSDGMSPPAALSRIAAAEPFSQYPEIVEAFRENTQ